MSTPSARRAAHTAEGEATLASGPTRILLICSGELFPNGTGATARLRAYARGLQLAGRDVKVLLLVTMRPERWPEPDAVARGEWSGVTYEYMSGIARGQRGWVRRRLREVRAIRRTCVEILRSPSEDGRAAVITFGTDLRVLVPVAAACRLAGIPLVHDRTESPFVYCAGVGALGTLWRRWYAANVFRLFDGVVAISTHLEEYVRPRTRRGAWTMRIPILVDAPAFDCGSEGERGLVGYAGTLGHPEEIAQLLEAVSLVRAAHPDTRVRIVGGGSDAEMRSVRDAAAVHGVADAVEMVGPARADQMPALLCGCAVLALPRAAGLFSTAGMPTKLGEYLATGRPVVVTATGDIPLYLRDGVEAFVTEPGDVRAVARALERALYEPTSLDVGRAGQRLARREFDPAVHMRRLLDAIENSSGGDSA